MKCLKCRCEILDKNAKICPNCGAKIKRDKFPVWAIVLIVLTVLFIPFLGIVGIVAAMVIPSLVNNASIAQFRASYKKDISTVNQSIELESAKAGHYYTTFEDVWNKAIKNNLNIESEIKDGLKLRDFSEIKYEKISDNCSVLNSNEVASEKTACAILTIDANGFDKAPNKLSTQENIRDQYIVLLYSNVVVPIPNSEEDKILHSN